MAYTNSSLITYKNITKNRTSPRYHVIDTITIHCYVGQVTAKQGCDYFATTNRQCSSNYVVGYDGSIGLSVEEKDRAWTSSSASNDNRAVTIEVACDPTYPYAVTDKAMTALINLVADICKRNNIKELKWKADKSLIGQVGKQNMTVHRWFAATACPGDYLYNKHSYIAEQVNKKLNAVSTVKYSSDIKSLVDKGIINSPDYWMAQQNNLNYLKALLNKLAKASQSKKVNSFGNVRDAINHLVKCKVIDTPTYWMNNYKKIKYLDNLLISAANHIQFDYLVQVTASSLNIRKGAGTNYAVVDTITNKGIYTIVEESKGSGSSKGWGKLKSGAGWISLDFVKKI
ncbi:MAG: N-acetylmuramoyl-L-alanine amidase [Paludibacteraceae bacterium]|nr:N-acetylmuramoyl-L-alanine amidase [Paludibacteraceae bacterium]